MSGFASFCQAVKIVALLDVGASCFFDSGAEDFLTALAVVFFVAFFIVLFLPLISLIVLASPMECECSLPILFAGTWGRNSWK